MRNAINILIIDDNEDDRVLYRRTLQKFTHKDYVFLETPTGEEGLACIAKEPPDCILLDYSLPVYNGLQILERIRGSYPFIPVVILTGQGNENVAVEAMQKGAQNYIIKSAITPEILDHVIRMAIEHCNMQKRIHEQRTSLEVFTHALAHDLNEPVRTINSFTELISQSGGLTEKTEGYFQYIQKAAARMRILIDTVFLYTRLSDANNMEREICDTAILLQEVKENLNTLIQERKTVITYNALPEVYMNRIQFLQVLQNLISNAIHHNEKAITVTIGAEESDDQWLFHITDNGIGINNVNSQKIFAPFRRLHHDDNRTGLGLAICKKIIESHNGKIWCEPSVPGTGARFLFTIPKSPQVSQKAEPAFKTALQATVPVEYKEDAQLANLLLVDDSRADVEMTRVKIIERPKLQCNFLVARDGEEALALLQDKSRSKPIDLMLIDINMPEMDGFELLERMRADEELKNISVVMCTGSTYDKDMQKAESLGAIGYLVKPINFSKLKSVIDKNPAIALRPKEDGYTLLRVA
jgi:signal transduction histidine kinase